MNNSNPGIYPPISLLPQGPSDLRVAPSSEERKVELSWLNTTFNAQSICIERSSNGINFDQIFCLPSDRTHVSNSGLTSGILYYYRIRSQNEFGNSNYSNIEKVTAP